MTKISIRDPLNLYRLLAVLNLVLDR
eukprot:SAG11_NODE_45734_length_142_cov_12.488372_1_plen_25_part_10